MADNWEVPLFNLDFGERECAAAEAVIRSQWLTMGDRVRQFESSFANYHDVPNAIAVSNCTAGLHLAYIATGVGPGDEVIVPSLTFVATANAAIAAGATPVFADITSAADYSVSPESILRSITPRTRAIAVVHYAGFSVDLAPIREIAEQREIALIEDCAHAPGARYGGRSVGSWGDIGCFSFFSNKNLATGEGGMLTTVRDDLAARLRSLRSHGMTSPTLDRHRGHAFTYDVVNAGFNYRMDELHAAIGCVQLEKLSAKNERRRTLTGLYRARLEPLVGEIPFARRRLDESACHLLPILLPTGTDRGSVMRSMARQRIQTSIHYPPVHRFQYYRERWPHVSLPATDQIAERLLTLPLFPDMTTTHVDQVCRALELALAEADSGVADHAQTSSSLS